MTSEKEDPQMFKIISAQEYLNKIKLDKNIENLQHKYFHDNINSRGFRGKEFGQSDALILGCSQTYGYSLPYKYMWSTMLCENLDISFSNLSFPGSSLQTQVLEAFRYFKEYGNPKVIFAAFPFSRIELPRVKFEIFFRGLISPDDKKSLFSINVLNLNSKLINSSTDLIIKKPFDFNNIIPIEFAVYYNEIFIMMLEQYCNSNNIKLYWTYWESTNEKFKDVVSYSHKSFFKFNSEEIFEKKYIFKDEYFNHMCESLKNDDLFYKAEDKIHWGIYQNLCVSDLMKREYNESKVI